jgi:hypothetical protein
MKSLDFRKRIIFSRMGLIILSLSASFFLSCDRVVFNELLQPLCVLSYLDNGSASGSVPRIQSHTIPETS